MASIGIILRGLSPAGRQSCTGRTASRLLCASRKTGSARTREVGRHRRDDLALEWATRGLEAFPGESRLADLVSDIHVAAGRHRQALDVDRELFARSPSLERYKRLKDRGEAAGTWPAERDAALATLRERIEHRRSVAAAVDGPVRGADGTVLVEILLWEHETDAAWDAAQTYGCDERLWLRLAATRSSDHPADAINIYRRQLDRALEPASNRAYDRVVELLTTMKSLYVADSRQGEFRTLVVDIRYDYKRRRNLISRLDRARLD